MASVCRYLKMSAPMTGQGPAGKGEAADNTSSAQGQGRTVPSTSTCRHQANFQCGGATRTTSTRKCNFIRPCLSYHIGVVLPSLGKLPLPPIPTWIQRRIAHSMLSCCLACAIVPWLPANSQPRIPRPHLRQNG